MIVFLLTAFQLAWPAFAYSIRDDNAAKRTYAYVLTYLLFITCWMSLAFGSLAPWIVHLINRNGTFAAPAEAVADPLLRDRRLLRLLGARDRDRPDAQDAAELGRERHRRALVNIAINFALIPRYGMMGAAVSTLVAYLVLFVGMWFRSRQVYPVHYQWRRILTARRRRRRPHRDRLGAPSRSRSRSRSRRLSARARCRSASTCRPS